MKSQLRFRKLGRVTIGVRRRIRPRRMWIERRRLAGRRLNDLRPPLFIKTEGPQRCLRCLEDDISLVV